MLASGSDDLKIKLWDPFRRKLITTIDTQHHGNIFSVKVRERTYLLTAFTLTHSLSLSMSSICHSQVITLLPVQPLILSFLFTTSIQSPSCKKYIRIEIVLNVQKWPTTLRFYFGVQVKMVLCFNMTFVAQVTRHREYLSATRLVITRTVIQRLNVCPLIPCEPIIQLLVVTIHSPGTHFLKCCLL